MRGTGRGTGGSVTPKQIDAAVDLVRRWALAEGAERERLWRIIDNQLAPYQVDGLLDYLWRTEGVETVWPALD